MRWVKQVRTIPTLLVDPVRTSKKQMTEYLGLFY